MDFLDICYTELIYICQKDKETGKEYFKKIFNEYFKNYSELEIDKPLNAIMGLYPLPNEFNIDILQKQDRVIRKDDTYFFLGTPGDRILFGNRRLPVVGKDPIPFTFPITQKNKTKVILSNTFYFEIQILNDACRKSWLNQCLSLGFGSINTSYRNQVGWSDKSWGFHSDDGCYINSNISKKYSQKWEKNDIIGVGLTYESKDQYKIFLTRNGLLVNDEECFICKDEILVPMMGYDLSYPVKVNWGQSEFKFDLENYISYSNILSVKNSFLSNNESINTYNVIPKISFSSKLFNSNIINMPSNWGDIYTNKITNEELQNNTNLKVLLTKKLVNDIDPSNNYYINNPELDNINFSGNNSDSSGNQYDYSGINNFLLHKLPNTTSMHSYMIHSPTLHSPTAHSSILQSYSSTYLPTLYSPLFNPGALTTTTTLFSPLNSTVSPSQNTTVFAPLNSPITLSTLFDSFQNQK